MDIAACGNGFTESTTRQPNTNTRDSMHVSGMYTPRFPLFIEYLTHISSENVVLLNRLCILQSPFHVVAFKSNQIWLTWIAQLVKMLNGDH